MKSRCDLQGLLVVWHLPAILAHFHLASFLFLCLVLLFLPSAQFCQDPYFLYVFYGALQLSLLAVASWYRSCALAVHALEPFFA